MRTEATCRACQDKPVTDTFVCRDCADQLHADLHAIPDITRDLLTELTGQARKAPRGIMATTTSSEQPLPVNLTAARALAQLRFALVAACLSVAGGQRDRLPVDRISAMADWLLHYEASVGLREDGGDICRGISSAIRRARNVCDSPPERIYIGECQCWEVEPSEDREGRKTRLYAEAGERYHECPRCAYLWDAADRYDEMQAELSDYGLTHSELETLLPKIPRATLARWLHGDSKQRPAVEPQGTTAAGEPAYRYGDVLALDARRRERAKARESA